MHKAGTCGGPEDPWGPEGDLMGTCGPGDPGTRRGTWVAWGPVGTGWWTWVPGGTRGWTWVPGGTRGVTRGTWGHLGGLGTRGYRGVGRGYQGEPFGVGPGDCVWGLEGGGTWWGDPRCPEEWMGGEQGGSGGSSGPGGSLRDLGTRAGVLGTLGARGGGGPRYPRE